MKKSQTSSPKPAIPGLKMIACVSKDLGLGKDNELLWKIPEDMKFFRNTTIGQTVVMGGNTYQSIGRPLPKRDNLVLSRSLAERRMNNKSHKDLCPDESSSESNQSASFRTEDGLSIFSDQDDLDRYLADLPGVKFIIGGARMYNDYLDRAETLYLTEVSDTKPADVYFPEFDKSKFTRKVLQTGDCDGIEYKIVEYTRE